ncbi:class I SAM-dependent methyltransferase [Streptomyces sp. LX-29]|uniref:class I SAM-dependent methyltransferase n=1 Tax=Streptomyces sp. LX-29 TaxID=2900152 RepID=UPI00240D6A7F|nr:class I SAM-dependent methyltransferase [Streptomyces sp. LX-29]WFB05695.1 class I SAM-dependent methyltransferase [Streptomyces sp. LX-29]
MPHSSAASYWESVWAAGRRYRQLDDAEIALLTQHLGAGHGRPALDIGCGSGELSHHLHQYLGYRVTGIDCAPSALALAASCDRDESEPGPTWRLMDFATDDVTKLPDPAYTAVTCRLVYTFIDDKPDFLDRVRRVLAPGGTFWVLTELAGRFDDNDPRKSLGITDHDIELLTTGWSSVTTVDIDRLRCFALRP